MNLTNTIIQSLGVEPSNHETKINWLNQIKIQIRNLWRESQTRESLSFNRKWEASKAGVQPTTI